MAARPDRAALVAERTAHVDPFRTGAGVTDAQLSTRGKMRCRKCGRVVKVAGIADHKRDAHGEIA